MQRFLFTTALMLAALAGRAQADDWRDTLTKGLPRLGHRNWIVIADSAYPAQTSSGIVTVDTGADQLEVVRGVLQAIAKCRHVRPAVFTDVELKYVPEADAPGISAYRAGLNKLLGERSAERLLHEQLLADLAKAGEQYRILVLKTTLTLPYTSVFVRLECGYWSDATERRLREAMKAAKWGSIDGVITPERTWRLAQMR